MNKIIENTKDHLFSGSSYPVPFEFNRNVVEVFDDMISRSVPMYKEVNSSILDWCKRYYKKDSSIIDIGCSTGTALLLLYKNIDCIKAEGYDLSVDMIEKARLKFNDLKKEHTNELSSIDFLVKDALDVSYTNSSFVIINYTLQFIDRARRADLLKKIHDEMLPGGILYISDKVLSDVDEFSSIEKDLYESFKESRGYSRTEIERKKRALENVLVPLKFSQELSLIKEAGFNEIDPIIRWNNFVSIVAKKS